MRRPTISTGFKNNLPPAKSWVMPVLELVSSTPGHPTRFLTSRLARHTFAKAAAGLMLQPKLPGVAVGVGVVSCATKVVAVPVAWIVTELAVAVGVGVGVVAGISA